MKSVLTSDEKKKVKKILRLNLSLVTVTNDKFFFFKMTSEFLFQEMDEFYIHGIIYAMTILIRQHIGWDGERVYRTRRYKYTADGRPMGQEGHIT